MVAPVISVAAGSLTTCVRHEDGRIFCWGRGRGDRISGANADGGSDFIRTSIGNDHICGLRVNASIACWGYDDSSSVLGPGGDGAADFVDVAVSAHTCGVRASGGLQRWGPDSNGCVDGPNTDAGQEFTQVAVGRAQTCERRADGSHICWGTRYVETRGLVAR